jgi:PTH1 family peptidyl-tRNA hydrolase
MYTIVGLGNPGTEYEKTRHNTGRIIVHALENARKLPNGARVLLPDTFMNRSGKAVAPYIQSIRAAKSLIVVHDDLDLPLGVVRVSFGSSAAGHNGVKSVQSAVKTKDFVRIRVGVSKLSRGKAKKPDGEKAILAYLLGKFTKGEYEKVTGPILDRVQAAIDAIADAKGDPIMGMNAVNGLPPIK